MGAVSFLIRAHHCLAEFLVDRQGRAAARFGPSFDPLKFELFVRVLPPHLATPWLLAFELNLQSIIVTSQALIRGRSLRDGPILLTQ